MKKIFIGLGIFIVIFSIITTLFGVYALLLADDMSDFLQEYSVQGKIEFDKAHWKSRWMLQASITLLVGAVLFASGLGIMKRKHWARMLFLLIVPVALLFNVTWKHTGMANYSYEFSTTTELFIIALAYVAILLALFNRRANSEFRQKALPNEAL